MIATTEARVAKHLPGEGEQRLRVRQRRFWSVIGGIMLLGGMAGFAAGFTEGFTGESLSQTLPPVGAWIGVIFLVVAFIFGSALFFRRADEVELVDNLWASMIGLYAYAILFPAWWALAQLNAAPEPNDWAIYTAALVTAGICYAWRKLRTL